MTVVVPTYSANWLLYNQIVTLVALIAATTSGTAARVQYQRQLGELQKQLVDGLLAEGELPASAILSTMTYGPADTNAV